MHMEGKNQGSSRCHRIKTNNLRLQNGFSIGFKILRLSFENKENIIFFKQRLAIIEKKLYLCGKEYKKSFKKQKPKNDETCNPHISS